MAIRANLYFGSMERPAHLAARLLRQVAAVDR
jgi:hypothetical protein